MANYKSKCIVNLSDFNLSEHHISLLNRGLKFCPTPGPPNPGEMREDMDRVHRRLRQIAFFDNPENGDLSIDGSQALNPCPDLVGDNLHSSQPFKHRKFKLPAGGKGPPAPQNLEAMITANESQFDQRPVFRPKHLSNITSEEQKALVELKSNQNIITRIADKGAAVVIQNRIDYLKEGYRQLSDTKFYQKLDHNPTAQYKREVNQQVEEMYQNGEIDQTVRDYLLVSTCRTPEFYTIPKIHKTPLKGRPIVSGNDGPTEKISRFVDHFLNPPTTRLQSFVKDTTHLLQILNRLGPLPPNTILATFDVSSLYTNINNVEGLKAAKATLNASRPDPHCKPSNVSLMKLLELVLTRTNFQFNGQQYKQIDGTCMGTRVAPSYAINTLGVFEDQFVYSYKLKCLVYLRYIDDIFILWTHGLETLQEFNIYLNSCTPHFKFTFEWSHAQVSFLDTLIKICDNQIVTDLYTKPTDSHNYLVYKSSHPQRCKDSIPYSQFLRIRRICSDIQDFDIHVVTFATYFLQRGYPLDLIKEAALKARETNRLSLLHPGVKNKDNNDKVFLITTYHPHDHSLRNILFQNWDILGRSPTTDFVHKRKLMCGYRRPKNLRDHLMTAKVPYKLGDEAADPHHTLALQQSSKVQGELPTVQPRPKQRSILEFLRIKPKTSPTIQNPTTSVKRQGTDPTKRGHTFCNLRSCRYCDLLNKTGHITSFTTGSQHTCMSNISCRSSNVIYAITCSICGIQYVGQTSVRLKDRFVHHFRDIELSNPDKTVGRHFSQRNHRGSKDMTISVLEFIKAPPKSPKAVIIRNRIERFWTHRLRTLAPQGLNMENPKEYGTKK